MKKGPGKRRKDFIEVLGDNDAIAVAITPQDAHHAPQVLAAPRASKSIFIKMPTTLTSSAKDRPENPGVVKVHGRRPAPHGRFAPFHAEIKRNSPTCSDPPGDIPARACPQVCADKNIKPGNERRLSSIRATNAHNIGAGISRDCSRFGPRFSMEAVSVRLVEALGVGEMGK